MADPWVVGSDQHDVKRLDELRAVGALFGPPPPPGPSGALPLDDAALGHRLLRRVNGRSAGLRRPVGSLREAADALGPGALRREAMLVALAGIARDRPETLVEPLARAKVCELIALARGDLGGLDAHFTAGLVSATEPLFAAPLTDIVACLPLLAPVRDAVLQHAGPMGAVLGAVVTGDGEALDHLVPDASVLPAVYDRAATFAEEASRELPRT
ncbi:MAG TPA: hypothetical protein VGI54_10990 [Solirubrobacteraceae bacterium]